jgi:hypothetical protein
VEAIVTVRLGPAAHGLGMPTRQVTIASTRMVDSHLLQPAVRPLRCAILGVGLTRLRRSLMALALLTKHVSAVETRLPVVFGREPFSLLARNAIR